MVYGREQENPRGGDHGDFLAAFARFTQPRTYLEVGVANGDTFNKVAPHCAAAVALDNNPASICARSASSENRRYVFADALGWLAKQEAEHFEMIFLDASHEYETTREEVVECLRLLVPNGNLIMHDTYPPNEAQAQPGFCGEAWRVAENLSQIELAAGVRCEAVTIAAQYGLTIVRKAFGWKQLLWKEA